MSRKKEGRERFLLPSGEPPDAQVLGARRRRGTTMSLPLLLLPRDRDRPVMPGAWHPMMLGALLLTAQSMLLIWSIARFRDAPGANIVYASRGVWSVLLVQLFALRRFTPAERLATPGHFTRRLIGSCIMMVGVFLAFA